MLWWWWPSKTYIRMSCSWFQFQINLQNFKKEGRKIQLLRNIFQFDFFFKLILENEKKSRNFFRCQNSFLLAMIMLNEIIFNKILSVKFRRQTGKQADKHANRLSLSIWLTLLNVCALCFYYKSIFLMYQISYDMAWHGNESFFSHATIS